MPDLKRFAITALRHVLRRCIPLARHLPSAPPSFETAGSSFTPKRILLLHPGHLGDIVIATSILPPLEMQFPGSEIGFVTGSWSAVALQKVKGITHVHTLDHWRLNRSGLSLWQKWLHYRRSRASALQTIRELRYDIAISLLDVDPDLLDVAWNAKIPCRVGWNSSYFAPLATRLAKHDPKTLRHQSMRQAQTLLALGIPAAYLDAVQSRVVEDTPASIAEVCALLRVSSIADVRYCVIHMGAGAPMKQMPASFWRHIAETLAHKYTLVFTGRGREENDTIEVVLRDLPNCINACDRLTWNGFITVVRAAETLYGVDSMAGHVAAAVGTPVVAAYQGSGGVSRWRPFHPLATVFTNHLPCAPCLLPLGCTAMPCKDIAPEALLTVLPAAFQAVQGLAT